MGTAKNAKVQIETGQDFNDFAIMTDAGSHTVYTVSGGTIWSKKSGFTADIRPNGVVTGRNLVTTSSTNNVVNVAAFTAYEAGSLEDVSADTATITLATTAGASKINSITMASDGSIAVVAGDENAGGFSDVRAAAGGPPLIPTTSVELAWIKTTSSTAGLVLSTEIFQDGSFTERYDFPVWDTSPLGDGQQADTPAEKNAHIKFGSALPLIHTGAVPKQVYMSYYEPVLSSLSRTVDFTKAEESGSVSSTQIYGNQTIGATSTTLGQGGFTAYLSDGITDSLVYNKGENLVVKFFPDENETPFCLTQGELYLTTTFPVDDQISAEVSISAATKTVEFSA